MRTVRSALVALGCWWLAGAQAQEAGQPPPEAPDLDFLEYLGAWAEEDDEWLAIEEWQKGQAAERDGDPKGSEKDDEDDGDESE